MSQFSRAHYLHTAHWLKNNVKPATRDEIANYLCRMFYADNTHFNEVLFYIEAGLLERETLDTQL